MEAKLTGDGHVALTARAGPLAERLKSLPQIGKVELWDVPFRTLRQQLTLERAPRFREALAFQPFALRPVLWKARTRHFQGRRQGEAESSGAAPEDIIDDHGEAARMYASKSVRPADREIAREASEEKRRVDTTAKLHATYWVGLLSFDDERFDVAEHWLRQSELTAAGSPWSAGARYNLARTYEAQGKFEDAVALLEQDTSPQQHGNRLRARSLKLKLEEANRSEE